MEIEKLSSVVSVQKSAALSPVKDRLAISAPDISQWVEELKAMPEIRPEVVAGVREKPTLDQLAHAIAQEML